MTELSIVAEQGAVGASGNLVTDGNLDMTKRTN